MPSAATAQAVSATILGTTADSTGAIIPAVHVIARETGSGFSRSAETNGAGEFQFPALPPGTYTVTATKDGFDQTVRENMLLVVNTTLCLHLSLAQARRARFLNVTAETPMLQTDRADVTMNFDSHQAENLPLYGTTIRRHWPLTLVESADCALKNALFNCTARGIGLCGRLESSGSDALGTADFPLRFESICC